MGKRVLAGLLIIVLILSCVACKKQKIGTPLADYQVVFSEKADKDTLRRYSTVFEKKYGVTINAVRETEAPSEHEIVFGLTNRDQGQAAAYLEGGAQQLPPYGWVILSDGKSVQVIAPTQFGLYFGFEELLQLGKCDNGEDQFFIEPGVYTYEEPVTTDNVELASGADIRVMSYNILHESWSNNGPAPIFGRAERLARILTYYQPDVVGLQEVSNSWYRQIGKQLVDDGIYQRACFSTELGAWMLTAFLYNPKTVKPVEEHIIALDPNSDIRILTVAVFEKLSDGKRFVVTNTHPNASGEGYTRNIETLMQVGAEQLEKYKDLPVIMTGDFNTREQSEVYTRIISELAVTDAKYQADTLVREYSTFLDGGWGGSAKPGSTGCLDHIFINSHAKSILFNVIIDLETEVTSDHLPIYGDIKLQ